MTVPLIVSDVGKSFTLHLRGGVEIAAVDHVRFSLRPGTCTVLAGPSGAGKSSILKMLYGNYAVPRGQILVLHDGAMVDLAQATARQVLAIRRGTIGYVSQFLRVVPRVGAVDIVAEPLIQRGVDRDRANDRARAMLGRLNLPEKLWDLPPATISGGEQQRVNIARGFITDHPILLLDEPTASLDKANRDVVIEMIAAKKRDGVALLGIFHDQDVRAAVADTLIDVGAFAPEMA